MLDGGFSVISPEMGTDMSKKRFTKEQIEILSRNENVHKVTDKYIVFEADFKRFCLENVKKGITLRQTFIDCGFDIDIIGFERMKNAYENWKRIDNENKELKTGHYGGGRPRKNPMTPEETIASQRKQIERLEAENDFLRQIQRLERRHQPQQSPSEKNSKR